MIRHFAAAGLSLLSVVFSCPVTAQEILHLPAPTWSINPLRYHVQEVTDDRKERAHAGIVQDNGRKQHLDFDTTSAGEVARHLPDSLMAARPNTVGLRMSIEELWIKDIVSGPRHRITIDLKLALYRSIDGKDVRLYESDYRPVMQATGTRPAGYLEKTVADGIREFFSGFDRWALEHPAQICFMNHIEVVFPTLESAADRDTIPWSSAFRLNWEDFQGVSPAISPYAAQSNCVYTLLTEPVFSNDTLYIRETIRPCFTRKASWVKPDALQDSLLMHEQGHFDLCELYGRKFRKNLDEASLNLTGFDQQINALFQQTWNAYQLEQDRYDSETEHGLIPEQQSGWLKLIEEELKKLEAYRSQ